MQDDQDIRVGKRPAPTHKYWVFISYSHDDEAWANWLHKALERYRIPRRLVGRQTPAGIIPKRLFPVFRDRDELPGAPSLPQKISEALEQSSSLVVICSPRSAVSQWVDKEIASYKQLGRSDRLFCLLVDGEPNASERPQLGLLEAFPEALRYEAGSDGQRRRVSTEPIAVDVRTDRDSKAKAKIRLIAGILDVAFDELWRRDRRRRLWQRIQLATVAVLVLSVISGVWWNRQKALEEQSRITEREQAVVRTNALASNALSVREQSGHMLELSVLLATEAMKRSLALDHFSPEINQTLRDGLALLPRRLSPALPHGSSYGTQVSFSPSGRWIATFKASKLWVWDGETGREVAELPHDGDVNFAVFDPANRLLASATSDGLVNLWDTTTWQSMLNLKHGAGVKQVVFSPDGSALASVAGPTVQIWETRSGKRTAELQQDKTIVAVTFSPNGDRLWSTGHDGTARCWDPTTGKEHRRITHGGKWPSKMSFSPDARLLAVALNDTTVWDLATGEQIAKTELPDQAYDVAVSPDGRYVATSNGFNTLLWEINTRRKTNLKHENTVWDVEFSHDGSRLVTASPDRTARIWEVSTGKESARMVHFDEVWKAFVSPTGTVIATVSAVSNAQQSTVYLWRTPEGATATELRHADNVLQVAITEDGGLLSTVSADFSVQAWETGSGEKVFETAFGGSLGAAGLSPDGRLIAAGEGRAGPVRIIDPSTKKVIARVAKGGDWVTVKAFSPDGTQLATTSRYAPVELWETATGRQVATIETIGVGHIAYSEDGSRLVTVAGRPTLPTMIAQVWQATTGEELLKIEHQGRLGRAALDSRGQHLFLTYEDTESNTRGTKVRVWDLTLGQQVDELSYDHSISTLAVSPDGQWLAIGDTDGNVRLWSKDSDVDQGRIRLETEVAKLVFTRDSKWLGVAAGSTASIWEVASRREIARMPRSARILDLAFSADGRWLITGSDDKVAEVWLWQPRDLIARACQQLSRNLIRKEWSEYLGAEEYALTCPNLPYRN